MDSAVKERRAQLSLERLMPRLEQEFAAEDRADWQSFVARTYTHFPRLFSLLVDLYGCHYDFFYHLERSLALAARTWFDRPTALKELDAVRLAQPDWYQSQEMLGGVYYVDLLAGDLVGLRKKISYFKELGLNYLHLMPLFQCPAEENDGGYAISDYRQVNPQLGTMDELRALAFELRREGISLVLDFVFNHTSDEHRWAQRALQGDPDYQAYYFIFPDREMPDAYERHLREIFPDEHSGSFIYRPELDGWVWTTFHAYQWDLNYRNPRVFRAMAEEMFFLANAGAEVLRLDALAFVWKELGTACESLPQAHMLIQAFNTLARIGTPSLLFKSEAIVHPDDVIKYVGYNECQLSYNPLLMALLWNSLATREVRLLRHSMAHHFQIPQTCAWVNYIRCHDDIGWTFDDRDAADLGINGFDHRRFLNDFYTGRFAGSFARGLPFQENPRTGDARISGTLASLAGLEQALQRQDRAEIELAIRRIQLLYAIVFSIGGIPLMYLGDEVGMLNDYGYREDLSRADDSRWVHRPAIEWEKMARRHDRDTVEGRVFGRLQHLIRLRKCHVGFGGSQMNVVHIGNDHVFAYVRMYGGERITVLANFTEREQMVSANELRLHGLSYYFTDLITGQPVDLKGDVVLEPYQVLWLMTPR